MSQPGAAKAEPVRGTVARLTNVLIDRGPMHRAELARVLGLSRTRVGSVVSNLVEKGILADVDGGATASIDGRAGPRVTLADRLGVVAGVQIGTTHTHVVLQSLAGTLLAERRRDRPLDPGSGEERFAIAAEMVRECLSDAGQDRLSAAGVGVFGQVDPDSGIVTTRPNGLWWGVNVRELSRQAFGVPTSVHNNSRLESVAEGLWGAGKGLSPMLSIVLGRGLTAHTVIDGEAMIGAHGGGGELGHTTIDIRGELCPCGGRGCLSLTASATAIVRRLRDTVSDDWETIIQAANDNNPAVMHAFLDAADVLGIAIASLANIIDPAVIVIGGDLLRSGPRFLERVITQVHDHSPTSSRRAQIVPSRFGGTGRGGSLAAARFARHQAVNELGI